MKLFDIPPFNHEQRDSSLRDQMIARIHQICDGFYTETEMNRMSDYALLCAFEISMTRIGHNSSTDQYNAGFDDGYNSSRTIHTQGTK
jgi:hypothetical protein